MPTNRDVADFFELRQGFQGMADFADAALRFLDKHGIALRVPARRVNGNGNGHHVVPSGDALRERVKRHYTKRRPTAAAPAPAPALTHGEKRLQQRAFSASILEQLDTAEPRPLPKDAMRAIGALVRRGYAKKKGDGLYVRTKKTFTARDDGTDATAAASDGPTITVAEAAKIIGVTDSAVRLYIKNGRLAANSEDRVPPGRTAVRPIMVLQRTDVERFRAELSA